MPIRHLICFVLGALFYLGGPVRAEIMLTELGQAGIAILDIKHANDGSNRLFLAGQRGLIRIYRNGEILEQPFLDIAGLVNSGANEQGLLSIAFPPGRGPKSHFYVYYTGADDATYISRYRITADPNVADPLSEERILRVGQPFENHNGGRLEFGPDGFLYLGYGDGGGANDPENNAQNTGTLLGKIIRIDVESGETPYSIPTDNPFVGDSAIRDEIWAVGVRNPWRIAFDRQTGDLFIADVGQSAREEINVQPAASSGGENYGWPAMEGNLCNGDCSGFVAPVWEYDHQQGCSITGGHIYRGSVYPDLNGAYLYGDFCSRTIWSLRQVSGEWQNQEVATAPVGITTFGEDEAGNLYAGLFGGLYLISDGEPQAAFPISGKISGNWINSELNDQGLNIMAGRRDDGSLFVFLAWYTYLNGEAFWIVGNADYPAGASEITVPMLRLEGIDFFQANTSANRIPIGSLTLKAQACDQIQVDYEFGDLGSGTVNLEPLLDIEGAECQ